MRSFAYLLRAVRSTMQIHAGNLGFGWPSLVPFAVSPDALSIARVPVSAVCWPFDLLLRASTKTASLELVQHKRVAAIANKIRPSIKNCANRFGKIFAVRLWRNIQSTNNRKILVVCPVGSGVLFACFGWYVGGGGGDGDGSCCCSD